MEEFKISIYYGGGKLNCAIFIFDSTARDRASAKGYSSTPDSVKLP